VVASVDVDSVVDQIGNERAQIVELQSILLARRQTRHRHHKSCPAGLEYWTRRVSGVLQFSDTTKGAGNAIGFAAGGLSTLLSFHSLRQQHTGVLPSMLAPFFSESQEHSVYLADTCAYLNSAPEGAASQAGRREQLLLAQWRRAGRFPPSDSPPSKPKIALLTGTDAADAKLNMDVLSERAAMLADVRDETLSGRDL
jgi:hypothetical protein